MFFPILGSLVQLLFLVAVVVAVVKMVSGRRSSTPDATPVTVKQILLYASLYATVHVSAWGVAGLIGLGGEESIGDRAATPLALTLVGLPVMFFLGRWVWRSLSDPSERDGVFGLYVNLTAVTALIALMVSAVMIGDWLIGGASYPGFAVGTLVAWAPIWMTHWLLWRRYRTDVSNLHVYVGAAAGLGTLATFGGIVTDHALLRLFDAGTDVNLTEFRDFELGLWFAGLAVGAIVFAGYWIGTGTKEPRNSLWHAYVVLVGVLGGLITAVVGAGISLYGALQWWLGDPGTSSAVRHFEDFLPALAALMVGLVVWFYHRRILGSGPVVRTEVRRVYDYALAAVGLVTSVVGVVILLIGLQEAIFPPADSMNSEANMLLGAITTLAVGAPLWAQAWMRTTRHVRAGDAEAVSPTRRSYLFASIGVAGATAAISLIVLLVTIFDELFGEGGGRLRDDIQVPVSLLISVGAVAWYHVVVLRGERGLISAEPAEPPKQVMLVTADEVFATAVRDLTGAQVTVMHRLDANGETADAAAVAAAVNAAAASNLLVVPGPAATVQVIPYRRR